MALKTRVWTRGGNALRFTELGFGAAPIGNLYRAISDEAAHEVLEAAWTAGVRYFDTAPMYNHGLAELRTGHSLR